MVSLEKSLTEKQFKCNNEYRCTFASKLIALDKLYRNNKDDIIEIIISRKIDIISIYDSYIHCVVERDHDFAFLERFLDENDKKCDKNSCIHYSRYSNIEIKNNLENREKYYNKHVISNCDIIQILDMIHCYLYHSNNNNSDKTATISNRRRQNSYKFVRNLSLSPQPPLTMNDDDDDDEKKEDKKQKKNKKGNRKNIEYFGGTLMDYWSSMDRNYNESDDDLIGDDYEKDGIIVIPKYNTLKEEVTKNNVAPLTENDYNDIYKKSMILLNTRYCRENMKALHDERLNCKFKIAPYSNIGINHIISIMIYCNYFNICCKWIDFQRKNDETHRDTILREDTSNISIISDDYGEFGHFYRYLCELCQIFGEDMKENEYLYIIPTTNVLFKEWNKMIYFPISVTPPLDITQSFMKELQQYQEKRNNGNILNEIMNDNIMNDNILKLGYCELNGMRTRYFDVRWLTDSFDEDERFIIMSPVNIYDILLDEKRSCLKDIYAIQLFQRIMNGEFFNCIPGLNQIETQKKLLLLIQNNIYSNVRKKYLEQNPSYKYIQDIFDNLVDELIQKRNNNGSFIWFNKSELTKLKLDDLMVSFYSFKHKRPGTLLKNYNFDGERIKFVQEYEFKIDEKVLDLLIKNNKNKMINSEDNEYIIDNSINMKRNSSLVEMEQEIQENIDINDNKISLYFEFTKKLVIEREDNNNDFECYLWINLILLPQYMDKVLIECNIYCDDLNKEIKFEPVWASKDSDNIGGLILNKNITKQLNNLQSLTFIITLKVLQTNAIRSPAKSILSHFQ